MIVEDVSAFTDRYGDDQPVAGQWTGGLSNSGERITVMAGTEVIQQFTYSDAWYPATDGAGFTLEIIDAASADVTRWNQAASWRASLQVGGSPGGTSEVRLPGDSNHDDRFDSSDLVQVFIAGEYEDNIPGNSTFEEGDWDGDGDFTTADFVLVLAAGTYHELAMAIGATRVSDIAEALPPLRVPDRRAESDLNPEMFAASPNRPPHPRQLEVQAVDSLFALTWD